MTEYGEILGISGQRSLVSQRLASGQPAVTNPHQAPASNQALAPAPGNQHSAAPV